LNPTAKAQKTVVRLNPQLLGTFKRTTEVDLMERPLKRVGARLAGNRLTITLPAHAVTSVRLAR